MSNNRKRVVNTTQSRIEKKQRVYNYLVNLIREGKSLPNLTGLSRVFTDMHTSTMMSVLQALDKDKKLIYHKGKVIAVNVPEEEKITVNKAEISHTVEETSYESKFDKAVKEVVADYILNANISTRDEIIGYVDAIVKITDKVKEKLFKER